MSHTDPKVFIHSPGRCPKTLWKTGKIRIGHPRSRAPFFRRFATDRGNRSGFLTRDAGKENAASEVLPTQATAMSRERTKNEYFKEP